MRRYLYTTVCTMSLVTGPLVAQEISIGGDSIREASFGIEQEVKALRHAYNSIIANLTARLNAAEDQIADLIVTDQNHAARLATLESSMASALGRIASLEAITTLHTKDLATLKTQMADIEKRLTALDKYVKDSVAALEKRMATAEKDITALEKDVKELEKDYKALEKRVTALEKRVVKIGSSCTTRAVNPDNDPWGSCPTNYMVTAVKSNGLVTGDKKWYGVIECCPLVD